MNTKIVTSRMKEELLEKVDEYAKSKLWSRNFAIIYILTTFLSKENRAS